MAKFRIENIMNFKFALFVISVLFCIWLGLIIKTENSFLNPSGNRNPANQKLMVVDQDSGEISFIQKSLQGVNNQIVADDKVIMDALKLILGDNLQGNSGGYIADILSDLDVFKTPQLTGDKGNTQTTMKDLRHKLDAAIGHGQGIVITYRIPGSTQPHGDFRLATTCNSSGMANDNPARWSKTTSCNIARGIMDIKRHDNDFAPTGHYW